jgi:cell division protein FtsI (penicillin-binding protein 3)
MSGGRPSVDGPRAPAQGWRFAALGLVLVGGFVYLATQLHEIQVVRHEELSDLAVRQSKRVRPITAPRGSVYDGQGTPLAVSDASWAVIADPSYMDDRLRAVVELARILRIPREDIRAQLESGRNGRVIAQGVPDPEPGDPDPVAEIRALRLAGIRLERQWGRRYGQPGLAAHVLGFVSEGRGGAGVELTMDKVLAGVNGSETVRVDARGRSLAGADVVPPRPGAHIQLTIDMAIQRQLEERLMAAVDKHAPTGASGIVVDPLTGDILAIASWPTFDPTDRRGLRPDALRNHVTSFVYEPGSTFKPLIAGAAVADGQARWSESIFCENGRWTLRHGRGVRTIHDHSFKNGGHQHLTLVKGIAVSDNILMAKLGIRLGPERLAWWVEHLNFGVKTGITLPGEEVGIVHPKHRWTVLGACMSVPMGHELSVTPIQLAMAHAAVANGGMWQPPRLVKRAWRVDDEGREVELALPALPAPRRFYQPDDAAQIQEAMTHTMEEGTGKAAQLDGYTSAGKTGTAEKLVGGRYSKSNHVGSFVCWAPAEPGVKPAAVALIVVDDPTRNGHYGGTVAAPYVRDVLQFTLEHRGIPKSQNATALDAQPRRRAR